MSVLYVKEPGAYVRKCGKRLQVEKDGKRLMDLPVFKLSNVNIIGNVQVTTQALHFMMQEGIDVSYLSHSGTYVGHMTADSSKNIFLRLAQYQCYQSVARRLEIAKRIVENKVNNQMVLIRNFRWTAEEYDRKKDLNEIKKMLDTLREKETSNEIMGVEGICSAIYFRAYSHMFRCKTIFPGRNRRPPRDPINAILSLTYTFLTKEIVAALEAESFETYLGFLHGIRYGRKSLALDLVEEFRQPAADRLVLRLFNKQMISEYDFDIEGDIVRLKEKSFKKFCVEYEKWMTQPVSGLDPRSFRDILKEQISQLKKAIRERTLYIPFGWGKENVSGLL